MSGQATDLIRKWTVNDYFTPNFKAEVILDTLLTPYIAEIIKAQLGDGVDEDIRFLTKEMSICEAPKKENTGPKIDYVLAGERHVYLVELKTTLSGINDAQAEKYLKSCQNARFGDILGQQLLSILSSKKQCFNLNLGSRESWNDQTLRDAFQRIIKKPFHLFHFAPDTEAHPNECADKAKELIRKNQWTQKGKYRSRKYLYTLGQLVDYLGEDGRTLWEKQMKVVYLTPDAGNPVIGGKGFLEASLTEAGRYLSQKEDGLARSLAGIMSEIYW